MSNQPQTPVMLKQELSQVQNDLDEILAKDASIASQIEDEILYLVKHAKTKARILGGLDCSIAAGAIKEINGIVSKTGSVLHTNASVMSQVQEHVQQQKPAQENTTLKTQAGDDNLQAEMASTTGSTNSAPSSSEASSTFKTAAELLAPLLEVVEMACKEEAIPTDLLKSLKISHEKSEDFRAARIVDFDECASPRIANTTPTRHEACLVFRFNSKSEPQTVAVADPSLDQYSPMTEESASEANKGATPRRSRMSSEWSRVSESGRGGGHHADSKSSAAAVGAPPLAATGVVSCESDTVPAGLNTLISQEGGSFDKMADADELEGGFVAGNHTPTRLQLQELAGELKSHQHAASV